MSDVDDATTEPGARASLDFNAELTNLAMDAVESPDSARTKLQALLYQTVADQEAHAEKLGLDPVAFRGFLGDANHDLVYTRDAGAVIKNLLTALKR